MNIETWFSCSLTTVVSVRPPKSIAWVIVYRLYGKADHSRKERLSQISSCSERHTINQESSPIRYDASRAVDLMDLGKNVHHRAEQSWKR